MPRGIRALCNSTCKIEKVKYHVVGIDCERKHLQNKILLLEEMFAIFDYCINNRAYTKIYTSNNMC